MLNEPASSLSDDHLSIRQIILPEITPTPERDPLYTEIREAVETVMAVSSEMFSVSDEEQAKQRDDLFLLPRNSQPLMMFKGRLLLDSEKAYEQLDALFQPHNLLPVFRQGDQHVIYVVQGRIQPNTGGMLLSLVLFILTLLSVLYVGTMMAINEIAMDNPVSAAEIASNLWPNLWRGWPYATSILLILGAHELGHYFMARRHKTAASLPYFLPFPLGVFGTFGAAIRLREPMRNRKVLFDIGAAGPLTGLVFAIPILLIGLATSPVLSPMAHLEEGLNIYYTEGNSIIYALSKFVVFGRFLPSGGEDVFVNQLAWAGWTGLLVTGLNLIPVGQLDGGHVLYSLLGRRAKQLYLPLVIGLFLLAILVANELLFFAFLILLMGNLHATPLDDITQLDKQRRYLAIFTLVVFLLVFVPQPLTQTVVEVGPNQDRIIYVLPVITMLLFTVRGRLAGLLHNLRHRVSR